ncbi:MAG: molybdate ABC transporter substrate-binding protein [Planctomycetota bacterium]|nr:MAG: molybdate ABC transporter substrate-binding protein [Planctomycetota bacterium]
MSSRSFSSSLRPWILACVAALGAGCSSEPQPGPARVELAVYAAASTRDALLALEEVYEQRHAVDLFFNFGSSGDLSKQIVAAAQADVFLSADEREMDKVEQAGLVAAGTRRALLSNQLVVIEPVDAPALFTAPFAPAQLADPRVARLSLADVATVPAGRYAKAWLERIGVWSSVAERVLPGVDARAALAAVESASAQAGIVYRTDAAPSKQVRVVFVVPVEDGPRISYPVAAMAGRPAQVQARLFAEFLATPAAGSVFAERGFVFLAGPTASTPN